MKKFFSVGLLTVVAAASFHLLGCSSGDSNDLRPGGAEAQPQPITPVGNFLQVERLARPAINEGLIITNDFLNAFNSIPPSADLSAAAAPVVNEAVQTLNAVALLPGAPTAQTVAAGFLPDVMRVDSTNNFAVGASAYNGDFVLVGGTAPMLTGGRKLTDDVIDITLSYLIAGDPSGATVQDNVPYTAPPGNTNPAIGHNPLDPAFPYLAPAN